MISSIMKGKDLHNYVNYYCSIMQSDIDNLDSQWEHKAIVRNLLEDAIIKLRSISKSSDTDICELICDRKTEKYTNWVEVMRLASFQYERFSQKKRARSEALYATLMEMALIWSKKFDLLEIAVPGCGPGRTVLDFARAFPNSTVYGYDYSFLSLFIGDQIVCGSTSTSIVRRDVYSEIGISEELTIQGFGLKNAHFFLCDLAESRIPDCDIIVCSNTINLLPNHKSAIAMLYSSLRPGGLMIFADLVGWRLDRQSSRKLLRNDSIIQSTFESFGLETLELFSGVPYIESESDDQEVIYNEHFYVGRKVKNE